MNDFNSIADIKKSKNFLEAILRNRNSYNFHDAEFDCIETAVDVLLDRIDPSIQRSYFVKIGDSWKIFDNAVSIKDLVLQVAEYTSNNDRLLQVALNGCKDQSDCIEMYNRFVDNYEAIHGIWKLEDHVFGDHV